RDLREMYNPKTWEEFTDLATGLDWEAFTAGADLPVDKVADVVACQPSFAEAAGQLIDSQPLEVWKSWARWKAIAALSPFLSSEFVDARFDFYERTLQGIEELRPRWKRGVGLVEGAMGEAVGRIYVERHFPPAAKD